MNTLIPQDARQCRNTYIVDVTPELALSWLTINNFNRPKNAEAVAKYVRQIREGRWRLTHQGAAFTKNGFLLDGQHRLFAIAECGVTVPMRICFNEPIDNYDVIDCGRNRSSLDVIRMGAKDSTLTAAHNQTLQCMLAGRLCKTANRWSNAELKEWYEVYQSSVNFTVDLFRHCRNKQINDKTVRGVIARAFYHAPKESLEIFCTQLTDGGDHPNGAAIDALRNCLTRWKDRKENTKREIFRRCELTLEAFLSNSASVSFDKNITELFPLPGEPR
jgi:hypothetical protein